MALSQLVSVICTALILGGSAATGPAVHLPTGADAGGPARARTYAAAVSDPVEDPYYPSKGDPRFDALHYDLDLRWAPRSSRLRGTATIDLRVAEDTDELLLDLSRHLTVKSVTLDGAPAAATREGNHLRIAAGGSLVTDSRHQLVIGYSGVPQPFRGKFSRPDVRKLGWVTAADGGASSMQEPFGAFTWYPVNDHPSDKAFYDATIDVPDRMVGVFNGKLVSREHVGSRTVTTWHLADPAAAYLVTIGIGDLVRVRDTGPHGVPISYWLPRDHTAKELRVARSLPRSMRWLEGRLGRYPFDRAGILATQDGSGMETQTLISVNRGILQDGQRNVLAHELAHHWYGDTVTPTSWPDLWLNESWAMYAQIRWEVHRGYQTMAEWRETLVDVDAQLRQLDGPPGAFHPRDFATASVYYCGALMLDQLRAKIGTAAFMDLWRAWPQQHRNTNADRADWIAWASARTGQDLGPFITRWLTAETTPHLVRP